MAYMKVYRLLKMSVEPSLYFKNIQLTLSTRLKEGLRLEPMPAAPGAFFAVSHPSTDCFHLIILIGASSLAQQQEPLVLKPSANDLK